MFHQVDPLDWGGGGAGDSVRVFHPSSNSYGLQLYALPAKITGNCSIDVIMIDDDHEA